jgi:phosphoribosyl 1,2-cyclic phosphate phosphodiesterase
VPTIGCSCAVCRSTDPRDQRLRPSIVVSYFGRNVLIDTTPDFRTQALRARLDRLDAVLFTHAHADHIMGLDDLRPFNYRQKDPIPIHASPDAMETIQRCFQYIFDGRKKESHVAALAPVVIEGGPLELFGLEFTPVPVLHGSKTIYGFRFGRAAYLTDHSQVPDASLSLLEGLDVLFLDALRYKPHPTHSTVEQSSALAERIRARVTYFTHICHDLSHAAAESALPPHLRLAYDGLEIDLGAAE